MITREKKKVMVTDISWYVTRIKCDQTWVTARAVIAAKPMHKEQMRGGGSLLTSLLLK